MDGKLTETISYVHPLKVCTHTVVYPQELAITTYIAIRAI